MKVKNKLIDLFYLVINCLITVSGIAINISSAVIIYSKINGLLNFINLTFCAILLAAWLYVRNVNKRKAEESDEFVDFIGLFWIICTIIYVASAIVI